MWDMISYNAMIGCEPRSYGEGFKVLKIALGTVDAIYYCSFDMQVSLHIYK